MAALRGADGRWQGDCTSVRHAVDRWSLNSHTSKVVFADNFALTNHVRTLLIAGSKSCSHVDSCHVSGRPKVAVSTALVIRLTASLPSVHIFFIRHLCSPVKSKLQSYVPAVCDSCPFSTLDTLAPNGTFKQNCQPT